MSFDAEEFRCPKCGRLTLGRSEAGERCGGQPAHADAILPIYGATPRPTAMRAMCDYTNIARATAMPRKPKGGAS